jgi:hypothetical protein
MFGGTLASRIENRPASRYALQGERPHAPMTHYLDYHPDDIDVRIAELLTATHDQADPLVHPKVGEALGILREKMNMDVVFVSQFHQGKRTFRVVETGRHNTRVVAGQSDPLEESWCHHVVSGRVPELIKDAAPLVAEGKLPEPGMEIGTHLSTPVVLENGTVFGTLCCFSHDVKDGVSAMDLRRLQVTAKVLSDELHAAGIGGEWKLEPAETPAHRR